MHEQQRREPDWEAIHRTFVELMPDEDAFRRVGERVGGLVSSKLTINMDERREVPEGPIDVLVDDLVTGFKEAASDLVLDLADETISFSDARNEMVEIFRAHVDELLMGVKELNEKEED